MIFDPKELSLITTVLAYYLNRAPIAATTEMIADVRVLRDRVNARLDEIYRLSEISKGRGSLPKPFDFIRYADGGPEPKPETETSDPVPETSDPPKPKPGEFVWYRDGSGRRRFGRVSSTSGLAIAVDGASGTRLIYPSSVLSIVPQSAQTTGVDGNIEDRRDPESYQAEPIPTDAYQRGDHLPDWKRDRFANLATPSLSSDQDIPNGSAVIVREANGSRWIDSQRGRVVRYYPATDSFKVDVETTHGPVSAMFQRNRLIPVVGNGS